MTDFEQVYVIYFDDVYRYLLSLSNDASLAEELTAETFFRALSALDSFRGDCSVRVWLCQIAKHLYCTQTRKNARLTPLDECVTPTEDVAERVSDRSAAECIQQHLHNLPDPYKEVFMWRVYGEKSFKEIARMFGKTENWACVTYHRARKMIRAGLDD